MNAVVRPEIQQEFGPLLAQSQYHGDGHKDGKVFKTHSIVYVADPYEARK